MKKTTLRRILLVLGATSLLGLCFTEAAAWELKIGNMFSSSGVWGNQWANAVEDVGRETYIYGNHSTGTGWGYSVVERDNENAVLYQDLVDRTVDENGADHLQPHGTDWADVYVHLSHGYTTCDGMISYDIVIDNPGYYYAWEGTYPVPDTCNCAATSNAGASRYNSSFGVSGTKRRPNTNDDIRFGGGTGGYDLNIFIAPVCDTITPCVWANGGYDNMKAGRYFNTYLGYYGRHDLDDPNANRGWKNYLRTATQEGVGSKYLGQLHRKKRNEAAQCKSGSKYAHDECPMVIIWGANESEVDDQFYHGGFRDYHDTGNNNMSKMYFIAGCHPDCRAALPLQENNRMRNN